MSNSRQSPRFVPSQIKTVKTVSNAATPKVERSFQTNRIQIKPRDNSKPASPLTQEFMLNCGKGLGSLALAVGVGYWLNNNAGAQTAVEVNDLPEQPDREAFKERFPEQAVTSQPQSPFESSSPVRFTPSTASLKPQSCYGPPGTCPTLAQPPLGSLSTKNTAYDAPLPPLATAVNPSWAAISRARQRINAYSNQINSTENGELKVIEGHTPSTVAIDAHTNNAPTTETSSGNSHMSSSRTSIFRSPVVEVNQTQLTSSQPVSIRAHISGPEVMAVASNESARETLIAESIPPDTQRLTTPGQNAAGPIFSRSLAEHSHSSDDAIPPVVSAILEASQSPDDSSSQSDLQSLTLVQFLKIANNPELAQKVLPIQLVEGISPRFSEESIANLPSRVIYLTTDRYRQRWNEANSLERQPTDLMPTFGFIDLKHELVVLPNYTNNESIDCCEDLSFSNSSLIFRKK